MQSINLSEYRKSHGSQFSEDGVIEKLFEIFSIKSGYLVEFGCWNGIYLSNTNYHRLKNPDFNTLLIESDVKRFKELIKNVPWTDKNILLNVAVSIEGECSLNSIFDKYSVGDIALLSIDVDGLDFEIFKSLDKLNYRPKIVIIEFGKWSNEAKLRQFVYYFNSHGYCLIHVTGNFIFIDTLKHKVKCDMDVIDMMKASGSPEYMCHYGLINEVQRADYEAQLEANPNLYAAFAREQIIYYE